MDLINRYLLKLEYLSERKKIMKGLSDYIGVITRLAFLIILIDFVEKNWVFDTTQATSKVMPYAGIIFLFFIYSLVIATSFSLIFVTAGHFSALIMVLRTSNKKWYSFGITSLVSLIGCAILASVFLVLFATLSTMNAGEHGIELLRNFQIKPR
ncbi:hypothetical protein [Agrobacterium cavarae]|uniref:hypothetical protein n=1 Tax=Agrobacterium cavarae TaxID=2528239 RepID=UPI002FDB3217